MTNISLLEQQECIVLEKDDDDTVRHVYQERIIQILEKSKQYIEISVGCFYRRFSRRDALKTNVFLKN